MSLYEDAVSAPGIALEFAEALEQELGEDALLTVGVPRASIAEVLGDEAVRVASLSFTTGEGTEGLVALVALHGFADALEELPRDELLLTSCAPALVATVRAVGAAAGVDVEPARPVESDLASIGDALGDGDGDVAVFALLEDTAPVGCLVVAVAAAEASMTASPSQSSPGEISPSREMNLNAPVALTDVLMSVTAEIGRSRMTTRDLLSISSGSVIDLDRSVGEPVDLLVNGTVVARGEVVVIDEEYGIRISEILQPQSTSR